MKQPLHSRTGPPDDAVTEKLVKRPSGKSAPVTMRDVANSSGFSPATVSIVLNNAPLARYIAPATKKKIEETARKLGYRPNAMARFLRSKRTHSVGVMFFDITDPFCTPILRGIENSLFQGSYVPILADAHNQRNRFERYLELLLERHVEALIVVALATGMRKGELQALRWQDIDLNAGIAKVTRTLKITPEGRRFGQAKTRYSRRTIALPEVASEALGAHLTRQREEQALLGDSWHDHDLVFCKESGERLPTSRLDAVGWYGRLLKRAGLPPIRFHDLRHTAATLLLARGVNVKVVSELLGHSSVAVTLSLYGHVLPHMQRDAAVAMDQALRGALLP